MAFLIGGILIGVIGTLTVWNTWKLRKAKVTIEEPTAEQKEEDRQFNNVMNYKGIAR